MPAISPRAISINTGHSGLSCVPTLARASKASLMRDSQKRKKRMQYVALEYLRGQFDAYDSYDKNAKAQYLGDARNAFSSRKTFSAEMRQVQHALDNASDFEEGIDKLESRVHGLLMVYTCLQYAGMMETDQVAKAEFNDDANDAFAEREMVKGVLSKLRRAKEKARVAARPCTPIPPIVKVSLAGTAPLPPSRVLVLTDSIFRPIAQMVVKSSVELSYAEVPMAEIALGQKFESTMKRIGDVSALVNGKKGKWIGY